MDHVHKDITINIIFPIDSYRIPYGILGEILQETRGPVKKIFIEKFLEKQISYQRKFLKESLRRNLRRNFQKNPWTLCMHKNTTRIWKTHLSRSLCEHMIVFQNFHKNSLGE